MLVIVLSACADNTKKNEGSKKEENKLLETTKNKEADEVAQRVLSSNLKDDTKSLIDDFNDEAIEDICDSEYNMQSCNRQVIEEDNLNPVDPTGEYQTILAQYDKNKASYIATYNGDYVEVTDKSAFTKIADTDLYLIQFSIEKDEGEYKVSSYYDWKESESVMKNFKDKKNVYELKGNYSDLFEE
ncbi:hypothetical protein [Mammaliicoccus sp. I-M35]|uniref:hypothetical protein n=1 Tax=Mammaliicoccus sp. I-M35 TaxID=2898694 RepID=UPI001EFA4C07|nr:hypothetical protein [Mammaliicoccus sp. I-M35]